MCVWEWGEGGIGSTCGRDKGVGFSVMAPAAMCRSGFLRETRTPAAAPPNLPGLGDRGASLAVVPGGPGPPEYGPFGPGDLRGRRVPPQVNVTGG